MNLSELKNIFLKIMIGCLIASGMLAVVTVLAGQFNEVFAKSLFTILLIALHALFSFGYININEKNESVNDLSFFHNTTFILIILSFITSIFGVWGIISGELVVKLYLTYGVLLFAVLHGETLSKMAGNDTTIDRMVQANYGFMVVVVLMILPVIYSSDASLLSDVYYRFLSAFGIVDAILTLLAIILNKLYLQKHPKVDSALFGNVSSVTVSSELNTGQAVKPARKGMSILLIILVGFLGIQLLGSLVFAVIGRQAARNLNNVNTNKPTTSQVATPTPTTVDNGGAPYSYETSFGYNGYNYKCTKNITGHWIRTGPLTKSAGQQLYTFSFIPAEQGDLTDFCVEV